MADPIKTHAAPAFKQLEERAATSDVDREDLRRLVQALRDWKMVVDGRLDQAQSAFVALRDLVVVLEGRAVSLNAEIVDLRTRVEALEARPG